jgi:hypothetical protein
MYDNDLELLDALFKHNGVVRSPIAVTPNFGRNREKEIALFIEQHISNAQRFVVLDDADLKLFPYNFVRCGLKDGIKELGIKEKIIKILL